MILQNRLARVSDSNRPEFMEAFRELEQFSNRYVREMSDKGLFPAAYPWPLDPLHNWTRWWEYTFAWLHVRRLLDARETVHILDVGSALTFFPVFLAQRGAHVHALDTDARMRVWSTTAIRRLECVTPDVLERFESLTADCRSTALADGSMDVVTNISVLEHLDQQERAIEELHRVLKPDGVFVNTLDLSLDGLPFGDSMPLPMAETEAFIEHLRSRFQTEVAVAFTHPLDVLTFSNRPRAITRMVTDTPSARTGLVNRWALKLWHRWLRQVVKVAQSRILVRPMAKAPVRALRFAFDSKRLDMWTVLGVVVHKQGCNG
jgi:SAM-dependent methyltransferase